MTDFPVVSHDALAFSQYPFNGEHDCSATFGGSISGRGTEEDLQANYLETLLNSTVWSESNSEYAYGLPEQLDLCGVKRQFDNEDDSIDPMPAQHEELGSCSLDDSQEETSSVENCRSASRRQRTIGPFARIPKRDIRRSFPSMLANALNSCNLPHIQAFFQRFCTPACRSTDFNHVPWSPSDKVVVKHIGGSLSVAERFMYVVDRFPDFAMVLSSSYILRRKNSSGCTVVLKVQLKGTRMCDPMALVTSDQNTTHIMPAWIFQSINASGHDANDKVANFRIVNFSQYKVCMDGFISLSLDSCNRITRVSIDHTGFIIQEC